jgi:hypothetical protein
MIDLGAAIGYPKVEFRAVVSLPDVASLVGGSNQGLYRVKYR